MYLNKKTMNLWRKQEEEEEYQVQEDLIQEERLKSKRLYKVFLVIIKYSPIICLICEILYSIFAYFKLSAICFTFIGGFSISGILLLYIASYVFRFCNLYRLSLHSIVLTNVLAIIDSTIGIPLESLNMLRLYLIILLIGVIAFIAFKYKEHKKSRPSN